MNFHNAIFPLIIGYIDPGTGGYVLGSGFTGLLIAAGSVFLVFLRKIWSYFKKRPFFIILILIILGYGIYMFVRDGMKDSDGKYNHKIIILGFDGLSPKILDRLMLERKLPHFLKLKQEGDYQHLATTNPPQSPVAWSSFATGKNPGKHDVFDFILRDPKDYSISLSLSHVQKNKPKTVLKAKGFWWYTSLKKVPTVVLGCPLTFPPEKIYGRMLSGMGVPDVRGTEGTFSFYTTQRVAKLAMGNVFWVNKGPTIVSYFWGPKYSNITGAVLKARVPFKVQLNQGRESVTMEYQQKKIDLKKGQWSAWQGITFNTGLLSKVYGIFKVYVVEIEPEFKLYVSPINFDPRHPLFAVSYPPEYSKEIAQRNGLFYTLGMPFDNWGVNEGLLSEPPFLEQVYQAFIERKDLLDLELGRFKKGVLYCYFGMPDIIQHMFWRYIDPEHPMFDAHEAVKYKGVIDQWYQRMDDVLGDAMGHMGKEDTLIVLSDHGFDTFRRAVHINSWLRDNHYLVLKDPTAIRGTPLFANVDWSKTKAYALGFGGIYINQKGRERDGIVSPGEDTQKIKTEIIQKMEGWTDDQNNGQVIHRIYRNEEIFFGDYANRAPDLFIGFNIGYEASWQTALGGAPDDLIEDNLKKWSGSHLFDPDLVPGILMSNKKIMIQNPSLYDLTPTIIKLIGYTDEEIKNFDFDGRPLLV
jgi:predicted AlkP superfamily phosphohydrolase/phosphomutase